MEDELEVGVFGVDALAYVAVELLEDGQVGAPPGLVEGLDAENRGVVSPVLEDLVDVIDGPLDIVVVHVFESAAIVVQRSHPFAPGMAPVLEVVLVEPLSAVGEAGVIKAVLGSLHGVDVNQDLKAVFRSSVEEPRDFLPSPVHAADIGAVRAVSPVTDGQTDDLHATVSQRFDVVFSDPGIPMCAHKFVALFRSERLADSEAVLAHTIAVLLASEAVIEGGGDPSLVDHPAADVGPNPELVGTGGTEGRK